jgi:hypothetical protein
MSDKQVLHISKVSELWEAGNRRTFLKLMAAGGAAVFLPSMLAGCDSTSTTSPSNTGAGTGTTLTLDFSKGDTAILQFAYALEQLEQAFYTAVVANSSFSSTFSASEQATLVDIRNHEVVHTAFLGAALGTNGFTLTPTFTSINFSNRSQILNAAQTFEFLGVGAYNGAAQYISNAAYLTLAGKIVSVEARHASAIADMISPKTGAFAPRQFENAYAPTTVGVDAQAYIVQKVALTNVPSTFTSVPFTNS